MTGSETPLSILLLCRPGLQHETVQLRVVRVDTGKVVNLSEGSFLLRIFPEEDGAIVRCFIRHIATGREVYIQSSTNLYAFVKACLLPDSHPDSTT